MLAFAMPAFAKTERSVWNQQKAIGLVNSVIAQEKSGEFSWNKIKWICDPEEASSLASKEGKPIFVFFFLKKDIGPKEAPC